MRCPICDKRLESKAERKADLCNVCKGVVNLTVFQMKEDTETGIPPPNVNVDDSFDEEEENG